MDVETTKRKRISKKRKSAWRKTDIRDVEEFLELQREDEIIGSFKDKTNEELFRIDTGCQNRKRNVLTEKQKRKLNAQKLCRFSKGLENTSKVPDPIRKRNIVKRKPFGRNLVEEVINPTKSRHFRANKDRSEHYAKRAARVKKRKQRNIDIEKDIWAEEDYRQKVPGLDSEWINPETSLHVVQNLGAPLVKVHDSIRHKTTKLKKFEAPHPGSSYNPSAEDYKHLMDNVVDKETEIIKEEKHLRRVTTEMFVKVTPEERDNRRLKEMTEGLEEEWENDETSENKVNDDGNSSEEEEQGGYQAVNMPVENKKKTKTMRNKEQRQRDLERRTLEKNKLKKQIVELNRIKSIRAEVQEEQEQLKAIKQRRKKAAEKKKFQPKRLSRLKYVDGEIDVSMPQDIAGNVRNIKPETSLLQTQFKRFQKRNILPMSVKVGKRKTAKLKKYLRSTHKAPEVSMEMLRQQRLNKDKSMNNKSL